MAPGRDKKKKGEGMNPPKYEKKIKKTNMASGAPLHPYFKLLAVQRGLTARVLHRGEKEKKKKNKEEGKGVKRKGKRAAHSLPQRLSDLSQPNWPSVCPGATAEVHGAKGERGGT